LKAGDHNLFTATCADIKDDKITNSKGWVKLEDESSPHSPYRPDLAPSDIHPLGTLKVALRGRRFVDDEQKHSAVKSCDTSEFYAAGIERITKSWNKLSIMKEILWKSNLNFVKDVPMTCVNFVTIVIVVSENKQETLLPYGPYYVAQHFLLKRHYCPNTCG
jgi:hypothetical protein